MYLHFLDGNKGVIVGAVEVNDRSASSFGFTVSATHRHRDTVTDEAVLFLVDLHEGSSGKAVFHKRFGFCDLPDIDPRVKLTECLTEIPHQKYLLIAFSPKGAVFAQHLFVIRKIHIPAQFIMQQVSGTVLYQLVFGVVGAHGITSDFSDSTNSSIVVINLSLAVSHVFGVIGCK